jgi:LDH2 family malate/lactate/ureidoglycolate dehydrogenase
LALVFDALAGVMTGAAFARDLASEPATAGNTFFWALDVEAFLPREEFLGRMEVQIEQVKAGERLAGVDELLVPGERSHRRYQGLIARGTAPLSVATWEALTKACASLSIAPPPALAAEPSPQTARRPSIARTGGRSRALPAGGLLFVHFLFT